MKIVGVISDTHGLLRPEALEALRGSELIIHAGDVGKSLDCRVHTIGARTMAKLERISLSEAKGRTADWAAQREQHDRDAAVRERPRHG